MFPVVVICSMLCISSFVDDVMFEGSVDLIQPLGGLQHMLKLTHQGQLCGQSHGVCSCLVFFIILTE